MNQFSSFLSIGQKDFIKGFILAIISAILTGVYGAIQTGKFPPDAAGWKAMAIVAIGAGVSYLIKNLFTNSNDEFMKKEKRQNL